MTHREDAVLSIVIGIVIGLALGLIVMGFLEIGSFDRGYESAMRVRHVR